MRSLIKSTVLAAAFLWLGQASAEEMNINQNNWRVGGYLGYSYSSASSAGTGNVNPFVEYFFLDRLAVGVDAVITYAPTYTLSTIGPVATYYFATAGKWAFSGQEEVMFSSGSNGSTSTTVSNTRLGADYFITPSVSFGPNLTYSTYLAPSNYNTGANTVTLLGSFSIFL